MTEPPEQAPQQPFPPPPPPPSYPAPNPYAAAPYPGGYPPAPPQPYAGYAPPPPSGPRNGLGVTALIVAIVALLASFSVVGGIVLGIVAVIIGFAGRSRAKRGEATNGGVALAGVVLGFLSIIVGLAFIAVWVGVFKEVGATDYIDCLQKAGQDQSQVQQCADEFKQSVENKFSVTLTPTP
ncbi:DUF4190 domain-containing protein [Mycolicibacterium sphagni]|uniref:DUF4190 domain-containing protein n=1 Tax=Mycolicibacterium sphagni TaxID=1786 RepID=A0A255DNJ8_9MYCO|nr:DUF4190 domain-containing protein [Mycolicibacterium sphagni]MCV7179838.1 DUF4190 domain-containing protein [Mycolicibacterium sphagni]OYN80670.1 DUF4190 domain-containing protein [Mycolicibacterium sphagni]